MNVTLRSPKFTHISLWIIQLVLAGSLGWSVAMKLFQPINKLAAMWPWTAQVPYALVKWTALVDLFGALGLILPTLLNIRPQLTSFTALAVIGLMICAIIFHVSRGEASLIGVNII
ncbi:MAG: DoxX family protein, partial [Cytophagaceae bacterium]